MKGFNGKIARIDLTNAEVSIENPSETFYRQYLGGRGFIVHHLLNELPAGIDPLGPENKLIFALGPVTGHPFIGSGRNSIGGKSPLSGGVKKGRIRCRHRPGRFRKTGIYLDKQRSSGDP